MRHLKEGLALQQADGPLLIVHARFDAARRVQRHHGPIRQRDLFLVTHLGLVDAKARLFSHLHRRRARRRKLRNANNYGQRHGRRHASARPQRRFHPQRLFRRRIGQRRQQVEILPVRRKPRKSFAMRRACLFPGVKLSLFRRRQRPLAMAHDPARRLILDGRAIREVHDVARWAHSPSPVRRRRTLSDSRGEVRSGPKGSRLAM